MHAVANAVIQVFVKNVLQSNSVLYFDQSKVGIPIAPKKAKVNISVL